MKNSICLLLLLLSLSALADEKFDIEKLREGIYEQAGHEFNIDSPKQLGFVIYDELELEKKGVTVWNQGADAFGGSGIAIKWIEVEGPLHNQWPPKSFET